MKTRTLASGRSVTVHRNDGLRKRCSCPRRMWPKCPDSWHFSFKWKDAHHRFPLDRYANRHVVSKDDARAEADRLRAAIRDGHFPPAPPDTPSAPSGLTFSAFADLWRTRAREQQSDTQRKNDQGIITRLCALDVAPGERLGDRLIGRVTEDDLETAFQHLNTLAAATQNKYLQVLLHLQRWGARKGYLTRRWLSEETDIKRQRGARRQRRLEPDVVDEKGRIQTPGEERRLLATASAWLQRLIIAALETCCRRGELLALQWRDLSRKGELVIRAENAKDDEARSLPISARLRAVLDMVRLDPAGNPHKPDAHVFGNAVGQKVGDPKKSWLRACRTAGITDLRFHDLRHEAASRMIEAGWPVHHVQQMLGHSDLKTTSLYVNLTLTGLLDSMRKFGTAPALHVVAQDDSSEPPPLCNDSDDTAAKPLTN
jgi:integrase